MRIENHRLVASEEAPELKPVFDLDEQGGVLVPEIAIVHYAVTRSADATARVLRARDYVSCHVTIDDKARVIQQVPFDRVAWHAGKSSYAGRVDVNKFSLGIEVSNPGPLLEKPEGYFTTYGARWTGEVIHARHKSGLFQAWKHWAAFSETELDLCAHICQLWRQTYGIKDIVGHDDVSPGRKADPGPAFPLYWLKDAVFPGGTPWDDRT